VWGGVAYDSSSDTVVVSAETGRTLALNGRSGAVIWSSEANAPVRSTPVIQGPDVYVVSDAKLLKLDSRSGQVRWTVELGAPLGERLPITDPKSRWDHYGSAASVSGGLVYVTSRDGCLYAFRAADGSSLWKSCTESLLTGTPAVALGRVVFGSFDGQVYAADASNGQALWKYNAVGAIPRDVVTVDQMAIIGSRSYDLLALDLATGRARWRNYFWYSWVDSVPTIRDSMLYIGSSDALKVFGLDVRTGKQRWACRMPGWAWAQPAVSPRTVYAGAVGSARAWAPRAGGFAAIDRSNGRLRWLLRSSPASGDQLLWGFAAAPAAAAGHVFAADLNGLVYAWTTPDEP
jgi:outer membrane protein assembly factor BamB